MFQNEEAAKYVLQAFLNINGQMDDSIRFVENKSTPEEYKAFKSAVGHVMYEVFERVVVPICKQHPSLRRAEMEVFR